MDTSDALVKLAAAAQEAVSLIQTLEGWLPEDRRTNGVELQAAINEAKKTSAFRQSFPLFAETL